MFSTLCVQYHMYVCTTPVYASKSWHLRSATHGDLAIPRSRTTSYDQRSFSVSRLTLWNTLSPTCVWISLTLTQFRHWFSSVIIVFAVAAAKLIVSIICTQLNLGHLAPCGWEPVVISLNCLLLSMNSTNETLLFDRFLIMYNLCVFTCIIFIFVFHCTHVRMSYVLNFYLLTYLLVLCTLEDSAVLQSLWNTTVAPPWQFTL